MSVFIYFSTSSLKDLPVKWLIIIKEVTMKQQMDIFPFPTSMKSPHLNYLLLFLLTMKKKDVSSFICKSNFLNNQYKNYLMRIQFYIFFINKKPIPKINKE